MPTQPPKNSRRADGAASERRTRSPGGAVRVVRSMSYGQILHGAELLAAAAVARGVDAVVGGGGLIQLPALLLAFPALPAATALGTNKLASIAGTSTAAATVRPAHSDTPGGGVPGRRAGRRLRESRRAVRVKPADAVLPAAHHGAADIRGPVRHPASDVRRGNRHRDVSRLRRITTTLLAGCRIGFYDGVFGPAGADPGGDPAVVRPCDISCAAAGPAAWTGNRRRPGPAPAPSHARRTARPRRRSWRR